MPIYEYKCNECNTTSEYLVKVSDPIPKCKKCESSNQEKLISSDTGVVFMGHGWTSPGMSKVSIGRSS